MLCGSLLFHGTLVGTAALWPHSTPPPTDFIYYCPTIDVVDEPGPAVDYKPLDAPTFAPPEITPPEERNSLSETDIPPDLDQEVADPGPAKPVTPPRSTPTRKPTRPAVSNMSTGPRPNLSTGSVANSVGGFGAGQPGNGTGMVGWKIPKLIYPATLRSQHVQGVAKLKIATDANGHVSEVVILKSTGNSLLDANTVQRVRLTWSGPPNASTVREVEYRLQ